MDSRLTSYRQYRDALTRLHRTLAALSVLSPALQAVVTDLKLPTTADGSVPGPWRGAVFDQSIRQGVLDRHRLRLRTVPSPIDTLILAASEQARFRVMNVRAVVDGVGVSVVDGLRGQGFDLVDAGLARTAVPGVTLAGWVLVLPELTMSAGGLVAVSRAGLDAIGASLKAGRLSGNPATVQAQDMVAEVAMAAEILRCVRRSAVV
ncbi:MAG: hypothetical protein ACI8RZ_004220 [Myxococcota bacterium]|jgi:hypothetical protein